jgi:hypothetical protein
VLNGLKLQEIPLPLLPNSKDDCDPHEKELLEQDPRRFINLRYEASKMSKEMMLWMEEDSSMDENAERTKHAPFSPTRRRRRDQSAHSRCSTFSDQAYRESYLYKKCARFGQVF